MESLPTVQESTAKTTDNPTSYTLVKANNVRERVGHFLSQYSFQVKAVTIAIVLLKLSVAGK